MSVLKVLLVVWAQSAWIIFHIEAILYMFSDNMFLVVLTMPITLIPPIIILIIEDICRGLDVRVSEGNGDE